jgi:hypothetical protein
MRFILLVAGAAATGALSAVGIQTVFPQGTAQAVKAVGDSVADFKLADLNPVRAAYDKVAREIASPDPAGRLGLPPGSPVTAKPIDPTIFKPFKIDNEGIQRAWAQDINRRVQQDMNRARDWQAFGRNPAGWRGPPPH